MKTIRASGASLRTSVRDLESVHLRKVDIEQDQVRLKFPGLLDGLESIRRLEGLAALTLLKRRADEIAEPRMVLDDENPQQHMGE